MQSRKMLRSTTYAAIVSLWTLMYSQIVFSPHSYKTSSDFGYVHVLSGPRFGTFSFAILYAARVWNPSNLAIAVLLSTHVSLP